MDEPLTEQELQAVEAIEAAFQFSTSASFSSSAPSIARKRHSDPLKDQDDQNCRRRLPNSIFSRPHSNVFSLSPCQANLRMRYPEMRFGGQILYSRTEIEAEKAAVELLRSLEAKKKEAGCVTVGFDIEWRPSFRKGVSPGKTAVMQLCADTNRCDVTHIIHSGIPRTLQLLLEDSTIFKVGVGIGNDCVKVFKEYNVSINAAEDISLLAKEKLGGDRGIWSLASLTEMLVCKELHKPKKIQLGNWEANVLTTEQLHYAATDAFASWHVYQVLRSFPNAID
ncbi:Werner Syndrome-like exonuclease [Tripterygium wilfordii]|uniref:3'-5' exonuclease n=1 Tax=Tripterygium wilfordii TaxID=458696 RepID=A0A7J7CGJ1_TRIWF|nr:Werner Syndrome-like exonuclease [Tripterygium wilfordii]KAF5733156.1 Werner Syndrome-like exonuclease [Tripterygium wilfordii]